jgi:hypothetical protein
MVPQSRRIVHDDKDKDDDGEASHGNASNSRRRSMALIELAGGIGGTREEPESNSLSQHRPYLKLNQEEPWERSLSKLLWDSTSSLHSSMNHQLGGQPPGSVTKQSTTGIFLLEHSESRDLCSEMDDASLTLAPSRSFTNDDDDGRSDRQRGSNGIYRPSERNGAVRDVSLLDSTSVSSASTTTPTATPSKSSSSGSNNNQASHPQQQRRTMYRSRSTNSPSSYRDDYHDHRLVVEYNDDDGRQQWQLQEDHRYHDIMQRRAQICHFRRQHRELFSPAHSFDDVTHFSEAMMIDLPYLPSLDDDDERNILDDSNTVRRLPPRYDTENSLLEDFLAHNDSNDKCKLHHHHHRRDSSPSDC